MVSALKQSEDGRGVVMRVWNPSSRRVDATITTMLPVKTACRLQLNETRLEDLPVCENRISLDIQAHKIETILLTP